MLVLVLVLVRAYYASAQLLLLSLLSLERLEGAGHAVTRQLARRHVWRDILLHVSRVTCSSQV